MAAKGASGNAGKARTGTRPVTEGKAAGKGKAPPARPRGGAKK